MGEFDLMSLAFRLDYSLYMGRGPGAVLSRRGFR